MFWNVWKMELSRVFHLRKILLATGGLVFLMLVSVPSVGFVEYIFQYGYDPSLSSVEQILVIMQFDDFKCMMAVILASLYTNSFCKDNNSNYFRMILSRTDVTVYTQCRFLANFCAILTVSMLSFVIYVVILLPVMPLLAVNEVYAGEYYRDILLQFPFLFVLMVGLIFGLVCTAASSVGLLYSAYHSNSFVSIAVSAIVLFMSLSYIPRIGPFQIHNMLGMNATIGMDTPPLLTFLWSIIYMLLVIGVCGLGFWHRMKWRMENGYV